MKILVVHASRHGATRGIAERIAATLERRGVDVTLRPATDPGQVEGFDGYIIGGAAYMYHWLDEATNFVRGYNSILRERPTWMFSSGPLGTELVDKEGRNVLEASVPREFAALDVLVRPREQRIFFGAYDPETKPIGVMERVTRLMPAAREAIPPGDYRDWDEIERWAESIADELRTTESPVPARA
jgi:menaquinone-dependent protoporphyrinogen oxidase